MRVSAFVSRTLHGLRATALSLAMMQMSTGPALAATSPNDLPSLGSLGKAQSPIKHVIVIIGENRSVQANNLLPGPFQLTSAADESQEAEMAALPLKITGCIDLAP
jgi:hypothetical protein